MAVVRAPGTGVSGDLDGPPAVHRSTGSPGVPGRARDHVSVVAALGRLGRQGGWDRMLAGRPLSGLDHVDAELLAGAGLLGRVTGDVYAVIDPGLVGLAGEDVERSSAAALREALGHLDRTSTGWTGTEPTHPLRGGRASPAAAAVVADELLPRMPGSLAALRWGSGRFLDIRCGAGALSAGLCRRFDSLTCVGIDVLDAALELAETELARLGLSDRVELRRQAVADLDDEDAFDLAWLPQPFVPRGDLEKAFVAVHRALRADRWLVLPLADTSDPDPFEVAVYTHEAELLGGGRLPVADAEAALATAGFGDVLQTAWEGQTVLLARRAT